MKKSILIAAVIAVIAELILWWAYNTYGVIVFGHGHANELGMLGFLFHAPGMVLATKLFGRTPDGIALYFGIFTMIATGALQFFLLVWPVVGFCLLLTSLRSQRTAASLPGQNEEGMTNHG